MINNIINKLKFNTHLVNKLEIFLFKSFEFIIYIITAVLLYKIIKIFLKKMLKNKISQKYIKEKKLNLMYSIVLNIIKYTIYFVAILVILKRIFNINPALIITATGILGLAVGLGIQGLLKDFISGLFILFEDKFNIGDYVNINNIKGKVSNINIKNVTIQDLTGKISIIPNRLINTIEKYNKKNIKVLFSIFTNEPLKKFKTNFKQIKKVMLDTYPNEIKIISEPNITNKIKEINNIKFYLIITPFADYTIEFTKKILLKIFNDILIEIKITPIQIVRDINT